MRVAPRAHDFNAVHSMRDIFLRGDGVFAKRSIEARPAAAGLELGAGSEKRMAATNTFVNTSALLVVEFSGIRTLGTL